MVFTDIIVRCDMGSLGGMFSCGVPSSLISVVGMKRGMVMPFNGGSIRNFMLGVRGSVGGSLRCGCVGRVPGGSFYLGRRLLSLNRCLDSSLLYALVSYCRTVLPGTLGTSVGAGVGVGCSSCVVVGGSVSMFGCVRARSEGGGRVRMLDGLVNGESLGHGCSDTYIGELVSGKVVILRGRRSGERVSCRAVAAGKVGLARRRGGTIERMLRDGSGGFLLCKIANDNGARMCVRLVGECVSVKGASVMLIPRVSLAPRVMSEFGDIFKDGITMFRDTLSRNRGCSRCEGVFGGRVGIMMNTEDTIFVPLAGVNLVVISRYRDAACGRRGGPGCGTVSITFGEKRCGGYGILLKDTAPLLRRCTHTGGNMFRLVGLAGEVDGALPRCRAMSVGVRTGGRGCVVSSILSGRVGDALSHNRRMVLLLGEQNCSAFLSYGGYNCIIGYPGYSVSLVCRGDDDDCSYRCYNCEAFDDAVYPGYRRSTVESLKLNARGLRSVMRGGCYIPILEVSTSAADHGGTRRGLVDRFSGNGCGVLVNARVMSGKLGFRGMALIKVVGPSADLSVPSFEDSREACRLLDRADKEINEFGLPNGIVVRACGGSGCICGSIVGGSCGSFFGCRVGVEGGLGCPPCFCVYDLVVVDSGFRDTTMMSGGVGGCLSGGLSRACVVLNPSIGSVIGLGGGCEFGVLVGCGGSSGLGGMLGRVGAVSFGGAAISVGVGVWCGRGNSFVGSGEIIFVNAPRFDIPILRVLVRGAGMMVMIARPSSCMKEGRRLGFDPIGRITLGCGVPMFRPRGVEGSCRDMLTYGPSVVVAYTCKRVVPDVLLSAPECRTVGIRTSLLPGLENNDPLRETVVGKCSGAKVAVVCVTPNVSSKSVVARDRVMVGSASGMSVVRSGLDILKEGLLLRALPSVFGNAGGEVGRGRDRMAFTCGVGERRRGLSFGGAIGRMCGRVEKVCPFPVDCTILGNRVVGIYRSGVNADGRGGPNRVVGVCGSNVKMDYDSKRVVVAGLGPDNGGRVLTDSCLGNGGGRSLLKGMFR